MNLQAHRSMDAGYWKREHWRPYSLGEELALWASAYPEKIALVAHSRRLSYAELHRRSERIAAGLRDNGVMPGMCAILQFPNAVEYVLAAFACFRLGVIPILTLPAYREADINILCEIVKPAAYFAPSRFMGYDYAPLAAQMRRRHASLRLFVSDDGTAPGSVALESMDGDPQEMSFPDAMDTAFILLSGGTTSAPKMIPKTHAQYVCNAMASAKRCGLVGESVYLAALPVGHHFCMGCPGIIGAFSQGAKVVLAGTPSFDEVFPLIEREKVTLTAAVPPLLRAWTEARAWDDSDLSSLNLVQVGGSPLDPGIAVAAMKALGCRIQQAYGFSEGLVCYTDPDDPSYLEDTRVQGPPLFEEDDLRIVDENGKDVPSGEEGELIVRGPCTLASYFCSEDLSRRNITAEGYCRSGDIAAWTPSGRLQIRGRLRDQINRAGEKFSSIEIEDQIRFYPGVADAAVVGVPDKTLGERTCAWVRLEEAAEMPVLSELHAFLRKRGVAPFKLPDQLEYVERWPVTAVGKINKRQLARMAEERRG